MSKIGKKPIHIPENVEIKINDGFLEFKSNSGAVKIKSLPHIKTEIKERIIFFTAENNLKQARANLGTIRALASNAIIGLTEGFSKTLEIEGVGYRANMEGEILTLNLGFSHQIKFVVPKDIKIAVEKNCIKISGYDKALVGGIAAQIEP